MAAVAVAVVAVAVVVAVHQVVMLSKPPLHDGCSWMLGEILNRDQFCHTELFRESPWPRLENRQARSGAATGPGPQRHEAMGGEHLTQGLGNRCGGKGKKGGDGTCIVLKQIECINHLEDWQGQASADAPAFEDRPP